MKLPENGGSKNGENLLLQAKQSIAVFPVLFINFPRLVEDKDLKRKRLTEESKKEQQ
jgi:hypothetical protein